MSKRLFLTTLLAVSAAFFSSCQQEDAAPAPIKAQATRLDPIIMAANEEIVGADDTVNAGPDAIIAANNAVASPASKVSAEAVATTIKKLADAKGLNEVLGLSSQLADFGKPAYPLILSELAASKGLARVALLRSLYYTSRDNAELDAAITGLTDLASGQDERDIRVASAELLEHLASPRHAKLLGKALDASFETPVRIALAISLWNSAKEEKALNVLKDLLNSDSSSVQKQAAIALGKVSQFEVAKDYLRIIANEPTLQGLTANELIQRERLQRKLLSDITGTKDDEPVHIDLAMLEHIIDMIGERYIYQEKVGETRLKEKAAEGLLVGLDPYCAYLDETQAKRAESVREFALPNLGIHLGASAFSFKREKREKDGFRAVTIISVQADSPADHAGLLPGDQILDAAPGIALPRVLEWRDGSAVKHEETVQDFLTLPLDAAIEAMRGAPGAPIALMIRRDGWDLSRWVSLENAEAVESTNTSISLEGNFRYARITSFSADTPKFFEAFIEGAKASEGVPQAKGLVIDLRSCAAGSSAAAIAAAQLFLPANAPVAHSFGKNTEIAPKTVILADAKNRDAVTPLVLLVDAGTSDAAEIFAAAMQDNKRAKLIGDFTFGRALIQKVIPLQAKKSKHALLLTVGKYVTPVSGTQILYRGLTPDQAIALSSEEGWVLDELDILRKSQAISSYVDKVMKEEALALKLAHADGRSIEGYPGFAEFLAAVTAPEEIHLEANHLRVAVRSLLRVKLREAGKLEGGDLQEDRIFMAGLESIAAATNVDLTKIDAYKEFVSAKK